MGADEDRNTNSTLDRVMLGSTTVTFGPGLSVQLIVTGFESRLGSPQHFTHLNAAIEKIDSRESFIEVAHSDANLASTTSKCEVSGSDRVFTYSRKVLAQQYDAQHRMWNALVDNTVNNAAASVHVLGDEGAAHVLMHVMGNDKRAVGALLVRVQSLVEGAPLAFWHPAFATPEAHRFFQDVFARTHAFVVVDVGSKTIRMCGDDAAVKEATDLVAHEVERLAALELIVTLKRKSVSFFMKKGMGILNETLGEGMANLDTSTKPPTIILRGGDDARHVLTDLIAESLAHSSSSATAGTLRDTQPCPVCSEMPVHPERLPCGHAYCISCLRHYLTTAQSRSAFPLVCMGDAARCRSPIPIPVIRRFVRAHHAFDALLRASFLNHLDRHADELKYCRTPDCTQIYRATPKGADSAAAFAECPSCFATVCTACHDEAHEGLSCSELAGARDRENDRLFSVWADKNGVKHCPACGIPIERIDGCNHIECRYVPLTFFSHSTIPFHYTRLLLKTPFGLETYNWLIFIGFAYGGSCGRHLCWKCLAVFDTFQEVYAHMEDAYGGPFEFNRRNENAA